MSPPDRWRHDLCGLRVAERSVFGVVTRLTLRTHPLPDYFGAVFATITAKSDGAYLTLVEQMISFYRESLLNPHWGEQIIFGHGPQITIRMLFQGLTQGQAEQTWAPLFAWVTARPADYTLTKPVFLTFPARDFWNPAVVGKVPGVIVPDDLPGAPSYYYYYYYYYYYGRPTPARWAGGSTPTSQPGFRSGFSTPNAARPWSTRWSGPARSGG